MQYADFHVSAKRLMCPVVVYFMYEVHTKMHAKDYTSNIRVVASIVLDVIKDTSHTHTHICTHTCTRNKNTKLYLHIYFEENLGFRKLITCSLHEI